MPIYWVTVAELEEDPDSSADEAIRLVGRYQWQDLRAVRLEDEPSAAFRKAVSHLAGELAARALRVTATVQDAPDSAVVAIAGRDVSGVLADGEDPEEPGLLDKLAQTEDAMPELTAILEQIGQEVENVGQLVAQADERMRAASTRSQGVKAQLVATEALARELGEPAQRIEELGHRYAEHLAALDPGIHVILDMATAEGEDEENGREGGELLRELQSLAQISDEALNELSGLIDVTGKAAKLSRSLRAPLRRMRTGLRGVVDGRAIIDEWGRRAAEIEAREIGPDEPGAPPGP